MARIHFLGELIGEPPRPQNASAMAAEALRLMGARYDNHPGGDNEAVFQANEIIAVSDAEANGSWQLRSGNPQKTGPLREKWKQSLARVTKAFQGDYKVDDGGSLLPGYKLAEDDPAIHVIQGAYRLVGGPSPQLIPTFGGSNVNQMVAGGGRKSILLVGTGADFIHTEREFWDLKDGLRAVQVVLGAVLFASQYRRVSQR